MSRLKTIRIEEAGLEKYNDLNCRLRTALENSKKEQFYLEISAGVDLEKSTPFYYISIDLLFRIDKEKDRRSNSSPGFYDHVLNEYETHKIEFNQRNLKALLEKFDLKFDIIWFTNQKEYAVKNEFNGYVLGN